MNLFEEIHMDRAERRRLIKKQGKNNQSKTLEQEAVEAIKLSRILLNNNNAQAAYELLQKYIDLPVKNIDLFNYYVMLSFQAEEYQRAEIAILQAINLWPNEVDFYNAAGTVNECLNNPEKAIKFYEKAADLYMMEE